MNAFIIDNWQGLSAFALFIFMGWVVNKRINELVGKDHNGRTIIDRLERVEYQLFPNGGASIKDQIDRIEYSNNHNREQIKYIHGEIKIIRDLINILVEKSK